MSLGLSLVLNQHTRLPRRSALYIYIRFIGSGIRQAFFLSAAQYFFWDTQAAFSNKHNSAVSCR